MSNNKQNKEQNNKIEQTENQRNPYLCRPEDWKVSTPDAPSEMEVPAHGQRGDNAREEAKLLAERRATGKGVDLPTEVDNASAPHQK
jgi:hypothetical protein